MTNLLCLLIGHKSKRYLLAIESYPDNTVFIEENMEIKKKVITFFLCERCHHRYKQSESFVKEKETK